jgi:muconate cycloisomerase
MRINVVRLHHIRIPFRVSFRHALKEHGSTESVIVAIKSSDGATGYGEILPRPYLTGETVDRAIFEYAEIFARRWLGRSFERKEELFDSLTQELDLAGRLLATFAGFELALLDLSGQVFDFAAGDVLQRPPGPELEAGAVIDFNITTENLKKHSLMLRLFSLRHVKVKVGLPDDLRRMAIISEVLGDEVRVRVDANAAWSAEQAVQALLPMQRFNIESVEQPVPACDLVGMRRVREETGLPVVADEALCSLSDAHEILHQEAADIFNIRLGKCGGFLASLRLATLAADNGLSCQLGTLVGETGILSRAAEIFGSRMGCFEYLEGKGQNRSLLIQDIVDPLPFDDAIRDGQGLNISVASDRLARWSISSPTIFRA